MLASTTGELRLVIPPWGCVLVMGAGVVYLVLGSKWPRLFNVLSMTVLGCAFGMVASSWVPLAKPLVIIAGGLVLGGLSAFFHNVTHPVLSAAVLAAVFAMLAGLAIGEGGFTSYLVVNLSERSYSTQIRGPNLTSDPVLAAMLTGLLVGATVAALRAGFSRRLVTAAQGAGLILVGLVELIGASRGEGSASLAIGYPLTLSACWLCLVAIGLVAQRALVGAETSWDTDADDLSEKGE